MEALLEGAPGTWGSWDPGRRSLDKGSEPLRCCKSQGGSCQAQANVCVECFRVTCSLRSWRHRSLEGACVKAPGSTLPVPGPAASCSLLCFYSHCPSFSRQVSSVGLGSELGSTCVNTRACVPSWSLCSAPCWVCPTARSEGRALGNPVSLLMGSQALESTVEPPSRGNAGLGSECSGQGAGLALSLGSSSGMWLPGHHRTDS